MAAATILAQSENATEVRRKSLLAESDVLLDDVETLRLEDKTHAPPRLREAIHALQPRLARRNPPLPPATLNAAHHLLSPLHHPLLPATPPPPPPPPPLTPPAS